MATIALDAVGDFLIHNHRPDKTAGNWAEGMWCSTTLGPSIHVLVGWDGLIKRAYDDADSEPSGYWVAES